MDKKAWVVLLVIGTLLFVVQPVLAKRAAKPAHMAAPGYAQSPQIQAEWLKHRMAVLPLMRRLWALKLELRILLLKDKLNVKAVTAKVKQIAAQKGKVMLQRILFKVALRKKYPQMALYGGPWGMMSSGMMGPGMMGPGGRGMMPMMRMMMPMMMRMMPMMMQMMRGGMMGPGMYGPGMMMPGVMPQGRGMPGPMMR